MDFPGTLAVALIAAVVAAAMSGAVTAVIFSAEGKRNYRTRLDDALAGIMLAIPDRVKELDDHHQRLEKMGSKSTKRTILTPGPYELGVRLEAALLIARGEDAKVLSAIADAFYALTDLAPLPQRARLSQLAAEIRKWRHGQLGPNPRSKFSRMALDMGKRNGLTPPPPWDFSHRVVTDAGSRYEAQRASWPWWRRIIENRRERRENRRS